MSASRRDRQAGPAGASAREVAVRCLLAFEDERRLIRETLEAEWARAQPSERERPAQAAATELAYGACRQAITLDHLIKRHSARPLRRIEPWLLQVLRVGLYELLWLEGAADYAVVHEAAAQAKSCGGKGAAGFANAVLRAVQRELAGPVAAGEAAEARRVLWVDEQRGWRFSAEVFPDPSASPEKFLGAALGHPLWLAARWVKRYGAQAATAICRANNLRPTPWLRANRLRCGVEQLQQRLAEAGFESVRHGVGLELAAAARPENLPGWAEGWFSVQDVSAMAVAEAAAPRPGQRVLDLCAAPGGKTTHLAELMENQGTIVACDVRAEKLERVEENCRRLGIEIVRTCLPDDPALAPAAAPFDVVLVDAPCSNTGVLARRVEARHRLRPADVASLRQVQAGLLQKASRLVRPGGALVYSTCSIESAENELQIEAFLAGQGAFRREKAFLMLPRGRAGGPADAGGQGPAAGRGRDGGYLAVLRRAERTTA